mgnify:CR=1 FL=1
MGTRATSEEGRPPRYINRYFVRCLAIDPRGTMAWTRPESSVDGETPELALLATRDDGTRIVLDAEGRESVSEAAAGPDDGRVLPTSP